jgi:hypothetical protein
MREVLHMSNETTDYITDNLEIAVENYVDSMDMDTLITEVQNSVLQYYQHNADTEEVMHFIQNWGAR